MSTQAIWQQKTTDANGKVCYLKEGWVLVRWRQLSWKEYSLVSKIRNPIVAAIETYEIVVTHGPSLHEVPCGIAQWVGQKVIEECPFSGRLKPVSDALVKARTAVSQDYLLSAQAVIAHTFKCSLKEVESWPADEFFRALAQAEYVLKAPLDPADPAAAAKKPGQRRSGRRF